MKPKSGGVIKSKLGKDIFILVKENSCCSADLGDLKHSHTA